MTTGREVQTPDGMTLRAFLDLFSFLGGTPGLKYFLDVIGHQGNACCHRCSFDASNNRSMHNHYLFLDGDGIKTVYRHSLLQHSAAREMRLPDAMLQNLGLRRITNECNLIMIRLAKLLCENVKNMPHTTKG